VFMPKVFCKSRLSKDRLGFLDSLPQQPLLISYILRCPEVHYLIHKSPRLVSVLRQMNPFNATPIYFSVVNFSIVLEPTCKTSHWSLSFWFSYESSIRILPTSMRATFSVHLILLDFMILIIHGVSKRALH
jgi:hypothetical protein